MKNKTILWIFLCAFTLPVVAFGGSIDSPGLPSAGSGMPTTTEIYNRLDTGAVIPSPGAFKEPTQGPGTGTSKSLLDIQGKLPVPDNTNGATAGDVLAGKTFWGLTNGQWGKQTGTGKRPRGCDPPDSDFYFNCLDDCISDVGQDVDCDTLVLNSPNLLSSKEFLQSIVRDKITTLPF